MTRDEIAKTKCDSCDMFGLCLYLPSQPCGFCVDFVNQILAIFDANCATCPWKMLGEEGMKNG